MKKIIFLTLSFLAPISSCWASFVEFSSSESSGDLRFPKPSNVDIFFNLISWILIPLVPVLFIYFFVWGIFYFFKKESQKNASGNSKKKIDLSWKSISLRLVIPLVLFLILFTMLKSRFAYLCDCFGNYSGMVSFFVSIAFFIGAVSRAYSMKKNKKEWRFVYTILTIALFSVSFYLIMWVGEYFYVPKF